MKLVIHSYAVSEHSCALNTMHPRTGPQEFLHLFQTLDSALFGLAIAALCSANRDVFSAVLSSQV